MAGQSAVRRRSTGRGGRGDPGGGAVGAWVTVRVHPRPGTLGGRLRVQQLVLVEVAVALVAIGWTVSRALAGAFAVPAVLLLVLAVVPLHGRSLPEALRVRAAGRARRREALGYLPPPGTDPGLAPVLAAHIMSGSGSRS